MLMILEMLLLDDGGSEILETWKDSMFEILTYSGSFYCHYDATMCNYSPGRMVGGDLSAYCSLKFEEIGPNSHVPTERYFTHNLE